MVIGSTRLTLRCWSRLKGGADNRYAEPGFYPPIIPGATQLSGVPEQGETNGSFAIFRYLVGWCCAPYAVRSENQAGSSVRQGRKRFALA